ncbi:MAG: amidohydrolase family protein [Planctomycetota bacterium]
MRMLLAIGLLGLASFTPPTDRAEIGTAVYVGEDILYEYDPEPALVRDVTDVPAARFAAVDVHCHWQLQSDPSDLLAAMDRRNVAYAVNLSGGTGLNLRKMLARFDDPRLITFMNIDYDGLDDPDWPAKTEQAIRENHAAGARGIKIWKNLGLTLKDDAGNVVRVDDPRLDAIWRTAGELGIPILIHVADPAAFFQPTDAKNERWMQLTRRPSWSFYGDEFPSREEVLAQRDNVLAKFPDTMFIGAHVANESEDLKSVAERLRKHPNLYADISGRVGELGRQPYSARKFLLEFQDRILFGTDRYPGRPDQPRYAIYYRFLETDDEYFKPYDHPFPPSGDWEIHGVFLPDDVLEKIYWSNAAKLLKLEPLD